MGGVKFWVNEKKLADVAEYVVCCCVMLKIVGFSHLLFVGYTLSSLSANGRHDVLHVHF